MHGCAWCPQRPEEGAGSPETGVREACESPCECWVWNLSPLEERPQQVLLTTEPGHKPQSHSLHGGCTCSKEQKCSLDKKHQACFTYCFDNQSLTFTELLPRYPCPHLENLSKVKPTAFGVHGGVRSPLYAPGIPRRCKRWHSIPFQPPSAAVQFCVGKHLFLQDPAILTLSPESVHSRQAFHLWVTSQALYCFLLSSLQISPIFGVCIIIFRLPESFIEFR